MNPHRCLCLSLVLLTCASFAQTQPVKPMRVTTRSQPAPPAATLLVGINDIVGSIAEPGWPLIVGATRMPNDQTASIPLPANLTVKVTNELGVEIPLTFEPVPRPATTTAPITLYWLAVESTTTRLTPGQYQVTLISPPNESTGWRIEVGELQVVAPNPAHVGVAGYLSVQRSALLGRNDEAIAGAERLTTARPNDPSAWIALGDTLMTQDKPDEALVAFDKALSLHKKTDREPIAIMTRRRAAFFRALEKRGVVAPKPAAP